MSAELFPTMLALGCALILIALFFRFVPVSLYLYAKRSGAEIDLGTLIGMRLRGLNPAKIVVPLVRANKAGIPVTAMHLEAHHLAGGRVDEVVDALIEAKFAYKELSFEEAAALDLLSIYGREGANSC